MAGTPIRQYLPLQPYNTVNPLNGLLDDAECEEDHVTRTVLPLMNEFMEHVNDLYSFYERYDEILQECMDLVYEVANNDITPDEAISSRQELIDELDSLFSSIEFKRKKVKQISMDIRSYFETYKITENSLRENIDKQESLCDKLTKQVADLKRKLLGANIENSGNKYNKNQYIESIESDASYPEYTNYTVQKTRYSTSENDMELIAKFKAWSQKNPP